MSQDSGQQTPVPLEDALAVAEKLQPAFNKLTVLFQRLSEESALTLSLIHI